MQQTLWVIVAVLASTALAIILIKIFSERPTRREPESPASFFALRQITSRRNAWLLSLICAGPPAVLFFILLVNSKTLIGTARNSIAKYIISGVDIKWKEAAGAVIDLVPDWLNPAFVTVSVIII